MYYNYYVPEKMQKTIGRMLVKCSNRPTSANTRRCANVGLLLFQHLRRWANGNPYTAMGDKINQAQAAVGDE